MLSEQDLSKNNFCKILRFFYQVRRRVGSKVTSLSFLCVAVEGEGKLGLSLLKLGQGSVNVQSDIKKDKIYHLLGVHYILV